jgi:hypothetical protein
MPLPDLLMAGYASGGIDSLRTLYSGTRSRFYEADAYDFRERTLIDVANRLEERGRMRDAASVHALNIEHHDTPSAHAGLLQTELLSSLESGGVEGMIARYHALKSERPATGFHPLTLDALAWRMFRGDGQEVGLRLFGLNHSEYPDSFAASESLAWASLRSGDPNRAIAVAEQWCAAHPDHEAGRGLLEELKGEIAKE